jgi:hypothetical protein
MRNGLQVERRFGLLAGAIILLFVMGLIWRNQPIQDDNLVILARAMLALGAGVVGATIPGFLRLDYKVGGLTLRAAGGMAMFVLVFFGSPKVVPSLRPTEARLELAPLGWVEFRAVATPKMLDDLDLDAPGAIIVDLRATNISDQLGKQIIIRNTTARLFVDDKAFDDFAAKYFVKIITGGTLYGGTPEDKLGVQSDASAISLRSQESIEQSILHISPKVGSLGYATAWRSILNLSLEKHITAVEVTVEAGDNGTYVLRCSIDRDRSVYLINSMLDEQGVFPRYFHANCEGEPKWTRLVKA